MSKNQTPPAPALYAVPIVGTLGRVHPEPEDSTRNPFQRDRDRIIHTRSFRRLKGKTQVFLTGVGDHYRTRLTHTMEVAQISRDIARYLNLNEDLAECIALAHDLGHPPFGHAGEEALNEWMEDHGSFFEHNQQSLRIVTVLENHSNQWPGLNLNNEVLEGLQKHRTPFDNPGGALFPGSFREDVFRAPSLEAQVVDLADEIAYTAHDSEDGLNEGLFTTEKITGISLAKTAYERTLKRGTSLRGGILNLLITDLYESFEKTIKKEKIRSLEDVYQAEKTLAGFSVPMRSRLDELRSFLWENMYQHPQVKEKNEEGRKIVLCLCTWFYKNPSGKISELIKSTGSDRLQAVKDYIAGMTDRFAKESFGGLP